MDEAAAGTRVWDGALVALYRDRYAELVRLAYLLTSDRAVAEELVQDSFVAAHRSWDRVRDPMPYLRTTVVNRCRSWGRRRRLEHDRRPAPADPATLGADELWDALGRLDPRRRAAVVLRFYLDLPDAEIAELLGCRRGTVRSSIHRALDTLRQEIER